MARTKMVAGNWKMNTTLPEALELAESLKGSLASIDGVERVLIPPYPWIVPVTLTLEGTSIKVGAQNCYVEPKGAFTGEVSPEMLAGTCDYVIVGHSERRHIFDETNELVAAKVSAVLRAGLSAIVCVGETLEVRESGNAESLVGTQLTSALEGIDGSGMERIAIAYEPVWAIGTGRAASAEDAQEMASFIRAQLQERFGQQVAGETRILYGGSVNGENASSIMARDDVDGALVGGASLKPDEFTKITAAASGSAD